MLGVGKAAKAAWGGIRTGGLKVGSAAKGAKEAIGADLADRGGGARAVGDALLQGTTGYMGKEWSGPKTAGMMALGAGWTMGGLGMLKDGVYDPIADAVTGHSAGIERDSIAESLRNDRLGRIDALRAELRRKEMQRIVMRLAATDPQTYQELMTGRRLPPQALVLGGGSGRDPMENDIMSMIASSILDSRGRGEFESAESRVPDALDMLMNGSL